MTNQPDEAEMRQILADTIRLSMPDTADFVVRGIADTSVITISRALEAMRSYASLVRERALEEAAQLADTAATQELGKYKDIKDAMLGRAVLDGWQTAARQIAVLTRMRKSKESQ